ncbi:MAG: hypothetical protein M9913_05160 [Bryobacteraceae bacterium]|nr:hypothetical protein [Bryobacteraceae bacterium]
MDAGAGEQGRDGDLAVGDIEVEFVAAPMIVVTPTVSFGADVALGRQVGEHGVGFLAALALDAGAALGGFGLGKGPFLRLVLPRFLFCRFCSRRASGTRSRASMAVES